MSRYSSVRGDQFKYIRDMAEDAMEMFAVSVGELPSGVSVDKSDPILTRLTIPVKDEGVTVQFTVDTGSGYAALDLYSASSTTGGSAAVSGDPLVSQSLYYDYLFSLRSAYDLNLWIFDTYTSELSQAADLLGGQEATESAIVSALGDLAENLGQSRYDITYDDVNGDEVVSLHVKSDGTVITYCVEPDDDQYYGFIVGPDGSEGDSTVSAGMSDLDTYKAVRDEYERYAELDSDQDEY